MLASIEEVQAYADEHQIPIHQAAIKLKSAIIKNNHVWPEPSDPDRFWSNNRQVPNIINDSTKGLLAEMARSASESYKFPINSAYLQALAIFASAATKAFKVTYFGKPKPVNLYACTAQPPGTGKSGITDCFLDPIDDVYDEINKRNRKKLKRLEAELKEIEGQISKKEANPVHHESKIEMMEKIEEDIKNTPQWVPSVKDATIEAAENLAKNQTGMVNIISDEAEAINTIFGNTYVKEGGKSNFGLLLSAWDGDRNSTVRIGREGYRGRVRSTIAVMAQDDSIESILRSGASGRGLAERFLIIAEKDLLGERDHTKYTPMDYAVEQNYEETVRNVLLEDNVILNTPKNYTKIMGEKRNEVEKDLGEGGKYEHNLITGFMAKMDKQVIKIASILHIAENWQLNGNKLTTISENHINEAIEIFMELSKTYISAADSMGYVGDSSEVIALSETFIRKLSRGETKISTRKLVNDVKRKQPFFGTRNLTRRMKEIILPRMQDMNHCMVDENTVYINPRLK